MVKTVLVSLNHVECIANVMAAASSLAEEYNSHIIGLFVMPSTVFYSGAFQTGHAINYPKVDKYFQGRKASAKKAFESIVRHKSFSSEWQETQAVGQTIEHGITQAARMADMVVIGRRDPELGRLSDDVELISKIVHRSGRPVLVIPSTKRKDFTWRTSSVGWDGSREAARAVFDAIPILKLSEQVYLTTINSKKEDESDNIVPSVTLTEALTRYGVSVSSRTVATRRRIGAALLESTDETNLLVIGAYGHMKLQERVLGGVTAKVLKERKAPFLMSN